MKSLISPGDNDFLIQGTYVLKHLPNCNVELEYTPGAQSLTVRIDPVLNEAFEYVSILNDSEALHFLQTKKIGELS